jgi:hypothetical protein
MITLEHIEHFEKHAPDDCHIIYCQVLNALNRSALCRLVTLFEAAEGVRAHSLTVSMHTEGDMHLTFNDMFFYTFPFSADPLFEPFSKMDSSTSEEVWAEIGEPLLAVFTPSFDTSRTDPMDSTVEDFLSYKVKLPLLRRLFKSIGLCVLDIQLDWDSRTITKRGGFGHDVHSMPSILVDVNDGRTTALQLSSLSDLYQSALIAHYWGLNDE